MKSMDGVEDVVAFVEGYWICIFGDCIGSAVIGT